MNFTELMENVTTVSLMTEDFLGLEGTNATTTMAAVASTLYSVPTTPDNGRFLIPKRKYSYDTNEFEIFLPCIFGMFVILCLGLMTFYTKKPEGYDPSAHKTVRNYTPAVTNEVREDLFTRKDEDRGMRSMFSSLDEDMRKSAFDYGPRAA